MIKFKSAVISSVFLHIFLFSIALFAPKAKSSSEVTYYVDLMNMPGGGTGGGSVKAVSTKKPEPVQKVQIEEPQKGNVKDLVVKKETVESKLKYPTDSRKKISKNKIKKEEQKEMVTVKRRQIKTNTNNTQEITGGQSEGIRSSLGSGSGTGGGSGGIGNFPYAYYVDRMKNMISSSWYKSTSQKNAQIFKTVIYFKIHRDGSVSEIRIEEESGSSMFDQNALRSVSRAAPFPPLPSDYPDRYLIVHFEFVRGDQ